MVVPCDGVSDCKLHAVGVVSTTMAFVAELLVSDSESSEKLLPPLPLPRQWPVVFMVMSGP